MKACNGRKRRKTYGAEVQALQEEVSILKRELADTRARRKLEEEEIQLNPEDGEQDDIPALNLTLEETDSI